MKTNIREVNRVNVNTFIEEFVNCNIIEVEVGTTGHCGGDTGHGCRTYFRIKNLSSTDMSCKVTGQSCGNAGEIEITFGGDSELHTFIQALEFALDKLKENADYHIEKV